MLATFWENAENSNYFQFYGRSNANMNKTIRVHFVLLDVNKKNSFRNFFVEKFFDSFLCVGFLIIQKYPESSSKIITFRHYNSHFSVSRPTFFLRWCQLETFYLRRPLWLSNQGCKPCIKFLIDQWCQKCHYFWHFFSNSNFKCLSSSFYPRRS